MLVSHRDPETAQSQCHNVTSDGIRSAELLHSPGVMSIAPCISDSAHMTSPYCTCHTSHHNTCHVSWDGPQMIRSSSQTSCDGWAEEGGDAVARWGQITTCSELR